MASVTFRSEQLIMTIHSNSSRASGALPSVVRKGVILLTLMAMQCHWVTPALADLYQKPLLSTTASTVLPNFVLTLDNSESMALNHLPEDTNKVNGTDVQMGGTKLIWMHPSDNTSLATHTLLRSVTGFVPGSIGDQCATVYECQMRSPAVNTIYYNPEVLYLPWPSATNPALRMPAASFTKAYLDPLKQSATDTGWVNLSSTVAVDAVWCTAYNSCAQSSQRFNPAIFYTLDAPKDPTLVSSYTKWDLNTRTEGYGSSYVIKGRTDCGTSTSTQCTIAQERQNFANWFTYHRSRILLTKGAVSEAFASLDNKLRLGWGSMEFAQTDNKVDGQTISGGPTQGVREFTSAYKQTFLTWLQQKTLKGSTPTRFATTGVGQYFLRSDAGSPWRNQPDASVSSPILGCRRAAHILTTDGYYNDDNGYGGNYPSFAGAVGEVDNTPATGYTPEAPYMDGNNRNSLADIAMKYWAFPAVPSTLFQNAGDKVSKVGKDDATWLHVNQFMVGLGVSGTVDQATVEKSKSYTWSTIDTTANNTSSSKIDDMIHAAINSRGQFFSANNGQAIRDAITEAIRGGTPPTKQESGASTAGLSAVTDDMIFVPSYNADGWYGDIIASTITANSNNIRSLATAKVWQASDKLASPADRNIVAYGATGAKAFTAANRASFDTIASNYQTDDFINYIRGNPDVKYRARKGKLPDFINSTPTLVGGNLDMAYDNIPTIGDSYRSYVNSKKKDRTPLLFMGGNGGMLHAFNASQDATTGGPEVFAYIPKAALPNLHLLAQLDYDHHFYVDGPLTEADAYIPKDSATAPSWRNVLIGTMGAGGRGVFAIDVTGTARSKDQTPGSADIGPSQVMWDISDNNDLGYVTSHVEVGYVPDGVTQVGEGDNAKTKAGDWFAFIGNGHEAPSRHAALLVVNLSTHEIVNTFELPDAADVTTPNGLTGVSLIRNKNGEVLGAYAGDLHGQVWRFEFSGPPTLTGNANAVTTNPQWKVGFGGHPLFVARSSTGAVQKITASPKHFQLPSSSGTGNLVTFGTGRLLELADAADTTSTETFYAVLDDTVGTTSSATNRLTDTNGGRSLLQQQTFLKTVQGNPLIQMSNNPVAFTGANKKYGWYVDLEFTSTNTPTITTIGLIHHPKVIYQPQIINGLVFFTAVVPPNLDNACASNPGDQYTFLLPVLTGGQAEFRTWDTNGDGVITDTDAQGQGFGVHDTTGESRLRDTQDARIGVDLTPNSNKHYNKCAAGLAFCTGDGDMMRIQDRVWQRIVKPPF
jgi:type IV pilus assembly protein PilY1